jgi:hypothetical protein
MPMLTSFEAPLTVPHVPPVRRLLFEVIDFFMPEAKFPDRLAMTVAHGTSGGG